MAMSKHLSSPSNPLSPNAGNPLVSVIIPFLDPPLDFFVEAIDSIIAQTYTTWELILINDGSTTESVEIAQRFTDKYPRKIFGYAHPNQQNRGTSATRQLGIQRSNGEFIAFLDADDIWLPAKLERQLQIFQQNPQAGLVFGKTRYWYNWSQKASRNLDHFPPLGLQTNRLYAPGNLVAHFLDGKGAIPNPTNIMVRKKELARVGGFEPQFTGLYDDQVFLLKFALNSHIYVSDFEWDAYRQHPQSMMALSSSKEYLQRSRQMFLGWTANYFVENQVLDAKIWIALHRQLWLLPNAASQKAVWRFNFAERLLRKWLLKIEERILPAKARQLVWLRTFNADEMPA